MVVMQRVSELPEISPAPGMLEIVRQFVNTLDIESGTDELDSPGALLGWLCKSGLGGLRRDAHAGGGPVTEADLALAISLREALRGVLSWHVRPGTRRTARRARIALAAGPARPQQPPSCARPPPRCGYVSRSATRARSRRRRTAPE